MHSKWEKKNALAGGKTGMGRKIPRCSCGSVLYFTEWDKRRKVWINLKNSCSAVEKCSEISYTKQTVPAISGHPGTDGEKEKSGRERWQAVK